MNTKDGDESATSRGDDWSALVDCADAIVQATIHELPNDVRAEAQAVPVVYKERSEQDGGGKVILGIYRGFTEGRISLRRGPIVLYLRTIQAVAEHGGEDFDSQVRRTFLHELGHHLGWSESDVRARGL